MAFPRATASVSEAAIQYAKGLSSWFRDYLTAIKHGRIHPFTPLERKVREATRNEPWGPTGCQLNELTEASLEPNSCSVIYAVLVFRLGYPPDKWRNVYKALQVLEFILKRGGDEGIDKAKEEFPERLEELSTFTYIGPDGRDYGVNVRVRAAAVEKLLKDDAQLKSERQKLTTFTQKLKGFTRVEMQEQSETDDIQRSNSWGGGQFVRSESNETERPTESTAPNRGAGEMKGVSLQDNQKYLAELKKILSRPENKLCADCREQMPTWASINCGVFICLKCSGIHRGLGVHVSKVRSCTLDTWLPEQVGFLSRTGNAVANAYWEATLQPHQRPVGDGGLRSFIIQKYSDKRFASGTWPPAKTAAEENDKSEAVQTSCNASTRQDNSTAQKSSQVTRLKIAEPVTPNDLLKFEDEAFASDSGMGASHQVQDKRMESSTMAELVAEEAVSQPHHKATLSFENSALFEQRSSFLRLQSQFGPRQIATPSTADNTPTRTIRSKEDRKGSDDVIKTTVLDLDDLESVSETMSLASQRLVVTGASTRMAASNGNWTPRRRPAAATAADASPQAHVQQNGASTSQPSIQQRRPTPPSLPPILDLLDAPLSVVPSVDALSPVHPEDPFSFMNAVEPITIIQQRDKTPAGRENTQAQSHHVTVNPQSVAASATGTTQLSSVLVQPLHQPVSQSVASPLSRLESQPVPPLAPELGSHPIPNDSYITTTTSGGSSDLPLGRSAKAGQPMNKVASTAQPVSLNDDELRSIQDMSRLDQLFIQQIEDFLHFGYATTVHKMPTTHH